MANMFPTDFTQYLNDPATLGILSNNKSVVDSYAQQGGTSKWANITDYINDPNTMNLLAGNHSVMDTYNMWNAGTFGAKNAPTPPVGNPAGSINEAGQTGYGAISSPQALAPSAPIAGSQAGAGAQTGGVSPVNPLPASAMLGLGL